MSKIEENPHEAIEKSEKILFPSHLGKIKYGVEKLFDIDVTEPIKDTADIANENRKELENFYKSMKDNIDKNSSLTEAEKYIRDRNIAREAIEEAKRTIRYKMEGTRNTAKNNEARKVKLNELLKKYEDGSAMTTEDKKEYKRLEYDIGLWNGQIYK